MHVWYGSLTCWKNFSKWHLNLLIFTRVDKTFQHAVQTLCAEHVKNHTFYSANTDGLAAHFGEQDIVYTITIENVYETRIEQNIPWILGLMNFAWQNSVYYTYQMINKMTNSFQIFIYAPNALACIHTYCMINILILFNMDMHVWIYIYKMNSLWMLEWLLFCRKSWWNLSTL